MVLQSLHNPNALIAKEPNIPDLSDLVVRTALAVPLIVLRYGHTRRSLVGSNAPLEIVRQLCLAILDC